MSLEDEMDLDELRARHPKWTIVREHGRLFCQYGPWRFYADADEVDAKIQARENPVTVEELGAWLANPEGS